MFPLPYTRTFVTVPTFASFLKEVDSSYEVHDYVRAYLGDTPEATDFAKQFLERRAKQNANQQKASPPQNHPQALKQQQVVTALPEKAQSNFVHQNGVRF